MAPAVHLDATRTARLVLDGATPPRPLPDAFATRHVPSPGSRAMQRALTQRDRLTYLGDCARPFQALRDRALGDAARGEPRLLLRVDEFPYYGSFADPDGWATTFEVFHRDALRGTPYLLALLPEVADEPLEPKATGTRRWTDREHDLAAQARRDGATFALHGFDHRSRSRRRPSELHGLDSKKLEALLDAGEARLGMSPRVFVAPYNRMDRGQYDVLASRFDVVCGGPETIRQLGWHPTPQWRGEAVYLPAYEPLYGRAGEVEAAITQLVAERIALWVPIVLHLSWEAQDEWAALVHLINRFGHLFQPWEQFLDAIEASR